MGKKMSVGKKNSKEEKENNPAEKKKTKKLKYNIKQSLTTKK